MLAEEYRFIVSGASYCERTRAVAFDPRNDLACRISFLHSGCLGIRMTETGERFGDFLVTIGDNEPLESLASGLLSP